MFKKSRPKVGARPGTLSIATDAPTPRVHSIRYDAEGIEELAILDPAKLREAYDESDIMWIDIQGFGDKSLMQQIGTMFDFHPLLLEDVVHAPQRPKVETHGDLLLIIVRMVRTNADPDGKGAEEIDTEQVSIVIGKNFVLTFQERYGDVLDPVRARIRSGKGIVRKQGSDYLAYMIADTIIDAYYPVLEVLGDQLEGLEEAVIENPTPELLLRLNQIKNRLINLRRSIWPQREAINELVRGDHEAITDGVRIYLRDTYDHCIQTSEVAEMYREMVTGLMNTYLSSIANRTNDVMKVLTIMSSVFIPLTFLAGIYGMNFEHMPELHMKWAYPAVWGLMLTMGGGMFGYFWRKGWLR